MSNAAVIKTVHAEIAAAGIAIDRLRGRPGTEAADYRLQAAGSAVADALMQLRLAAAIGVDIVIEADAA